MNIHPHLLSFVFAFAVFVWPFSTKAASPGCSTSGCHATLKTQVVHGPVRANGCDVCHDFGVRLKAGSPAKTPALTDGEHPAVYTPKGLAANDTCLICHDKIKQALHDKKFHAHKVVGEKGCISCHEPHHSPRKNLLREEPEALCLSCHQKVHAEALPFRHGALQENKSCLGCHQPHAGPTAKLLKDTEKKVCFSCHKTKAKEIAAHAVQHAPVAEGRCTKCHQPHSGDQRMLLKANYSEAFYNAFGEDQFKLCFSCHKSSLATAARAESETNFRNGTVNLHYVHAVQQGAKGRSCRACHDPHSSSAPKLIQEWMPFLGAKVPLHFEPRPSGGTCTTSCHKVREYSRTKEVINDKNR